MCSQQPQCTSGLMHVARGSRCLHQFNCSSSRLDEAQHRTSQPLHAAGKPHDNSSRTFPPVQLYVASCAGGAGGAGTAVSVTSASLRCLTYCWSSADRWAGWRCSMEAVQEVSIVSPLTSSPWMTVTEGSLA